MRHVILVVPISHGVGLTTTSIGLVRALDRAGMKVGFCKPIEQQRPGDYGPERSTALVRLTTQCNPPEPIPRHDADRLWSSGDDQVLLERVIGVFEKVDSNAEVVVVEGLVPTAEISFADRINQQIADALDAKVIVVGAPVPEGHDEMAEHLGITARGYGGRVLGVIVNKVELGRRREIIEPVLGEAPVIDQALIDRKFGPVRDALNKAGLPIVGLLPKLRELAAPRAMDLARHLGAMALNKGDWENRRIMSLHLCARNVAHTLGAFVNGALIITPGDRDDIILAACVATLGGVRLGGLLLTGGFKPNVNIMDLCQSAFDTGLPVMLVDNDTYVTATDVHEMDGEVPVDDRVRADLVMNTVASFLDEDALRGCTDTQRLERRLSPPAFRHNLIELSRTAAKRIVLPEGSEPRTLAAAAICQQRGIATCVLIGEQEEIDEACRKAGVTLPAGVEILEPSKMKERYVAPMVELRKSKGLSEAAALDQLGDNVVLGTMMVKLGEVDGLVSGAIHSTANTIRPALQLIKTAPDSSIVSSIFFMCLPEQVVVYGDCAVNPDPTAEQLAEIAIQSAASAKAFGIPPRVAMISYSTGSSGAGAEVEKVAEATRIAKERCPDLLIDGPLQYDAAAIESVGKSKAPDSPVAGKATVFVFPDLNTGNTTYKAVQRSANVVSIGPMLQGLAAPVNDLSRGALVEDIVYTIALTAIQAYSDAV